LLGAVVRADDDAARDEQPRRIRARIVDRVAAKHWIGVHAEPIDDAIKAQLNLEDRLIVRAVMPDSPAAKGGLKPHDILLKFGDREIRNLDELLKAVSDNDGKAIKLVVLRAGKESTLDIQPTERPADVRETNSPDRLPVVRALEDWLREPREERLPFVGPGLRYELNALPGNLSITVTKHNDEPAKISVKWDDDSWEITESEIGKLPEELREHVQRHLDGQHGLRRTSQILSLDEDGAIRVHQPRVTANDGADEAIRERMEIGLERLEQIQRRLSDDDPFKALQEEMKLLREAVEKLQQQSQPEDPPATEARDA
jgi:membrane-associated protease RseP (regulator of RpoE activity)